MSFIMLNESSRSAAGAHEEEGGRRRSGAREETTPDTQGLGDEDAAFSDQIEKTTRLFEIISARSDIDHPVCTECTDLLVEGLQKRLSAATKERDAYISFLKNLNASIPSTEEVKAAEESLEATLKAEEEAMEELRSLEMEKAEVDKELKELQDEEIDLDREEVEFWRDRNDFVRMLSGFQDSRDALNRKFDHDCGQLEKLQRTNVYNDTFCIGHDGYFGTINGLRLGRLSNPSVDWAEINAAWGQTLLLLVTVADRLGFQFQGYKLRPMGSASQIEKIEYPKQQQQSPTDGTSSPRRTPHTDESTTPTAGRQPPQHQPQQQEEEETAATAATAAGVPPKTTVLDLFSHGDLPLNLPWLHRRFDSGMVTFLECLRQLGEHVERATSTPSPSPSRRSTPSQAVPGRSSPATRGSPQPQQVAGLKLPYVIQGDKIGDASIKLGFSQSDETWTRACKYTLTCCKYLLAHASNAGGGRGGSPSPAAAGTAGAAGIRERQG